MNFTTNQERAILAGGCNFLVSAAAGSGKTRVLVERIKRKIVEDNEDILHMLILTFTRAAAKEMKDRLIKSLQDELKNTEKNSDLHEHITKQLVAINIADIGTIDSFCFRFLKKYYFVIENLDPNFRILQDGSEQDVLKNSVWEQVREEFYKKRENLLDINDIKELDDYDIFLHLFTKDRNDDMLWEAVNSLNNFLVANPEPNEWLKQAINNYQFNENTFTENQIWKDYIKKIVISHLWEGLSNYEFYLEKFELVQIPLMNSFYQKKSKNNSLDKLNEKIINHKEMIKQINQAIEQLLEKIKNDILNWNELCQHYDNLQKLLLKKTINFRKGTDFAGDDNSVSKIKQVKFYLDNAKDSIINLKDYFTYNDVQLKKISSRANRILRKLIDLTKKFRKAYLQAKLSNKTLEFSDLEYLTLKILTDQDDVEIKINHKIQHKIQHKMKNYYKEIMIDEYQDTNNMQEAIIQAMAHDNLFMVGDIKQSIYRFRQADPNLFKEKFDNYKKYDNGDNDKGYKISLRDNFRSLSDITSVTNFIFSKLMDKSIGNIDYDRESQLIASNFKYNEFDSLLKGASFLLYLNDGNNSNPLDSNISKEEAQLVMIANKIKELQDKKVQIYDNKQSKLRSLELSDIAVLSSKNQDSEIVLNVFKKMGINVNIDDSSKYFNTTDIQLIISYLKIIDNPYQDIPLVSVLRSPMYNLDENELTYLRINYPEDKFYKVLINYWRQYQKDFSSLKEYDKNKQYKIWYKVNNFIKDLRMFRDQSKLNEISDLIWNIYNETGFLNFVGGLCDGQRRQANLHALYERAMLYEQSNFKGLFQFLNFIKDMVEKQKKDLNSIHLQSDKQAVTFMTIHKSKGLEYPVVFIIDLNRHFGFINKHNDNNLVIDNKLGIGFNVIEPLKSVVKKNNIILNDDNNFDVLETTPISWAIDNEQKKEFLGEEMRKLYVAITRARQKVYFVGTYKNIDKWYEEWISNSSLNSNMLSVNKILDSPNPKMLLVNKILSATNYMNWLGSIFGTVENLKDRIFVNDIDDNGNLRIHRLNLDMSNDTANNNVDKVDFDFQIEFFKKDAINFLMNDSVVENNLSTKLVNDNMNNELDSNIKKILDFKYFNQVATLTPAYESVTDIRHNFDDPDNNSMYLIDTKGLSLNNVTKPIQQSVIFNSPNFISTEVKVSPAQLGLATHLIFQKIDINHPIDRVTVQFLLKKLVDDGSIVYEVADQLKRKNIIDGIVDFYKTTLGQKIVNNPECVQREVPFSLLLPIKNNDRNQILVHGIIDGYFIDPISQQVYLFDYKTDNLPLDKIKLEYIGQLNLYAKALAIITHRKIKHKFLYSVKSRKIINL